MLARQWRKIVHYHRTLPSIRRTPYATKSRTGRPICRGRLSAAARRVDPIIAEYEAYIGRRDEIGAYIETLPEGLRG